MSLIVELNLYKLRYVTFSFLSVTSSELKGLGQYLCVWFKMDQEISDAFASEVL